MTITVRMATDDDVAAIIDVGHRTWPATYEPFTGPEYVADGLARWWSAEAIRRGITRTVVAEDPTGAIVGMASYAPNDDILILWKLYVVPEAQGTGAGSALIRKVITDASGRYRAVHLEYLDGNNHAAEFYARNGFTYLKRETDPDGGPDSIWLARPDS
ncbi:MAG TPA: GNAT family N-acetyltransferase [Pseudonocardiaceae bacterium]|nr:GNAT family N-acetyltransferase [Pseudonocardiaceae bacterium]